MSSLDDIRLGFFTRARMPLTRLGGALCLLYVALAAPSAYLSAWGAVTSELAGFALLIFAAMGRMWCLVHISGNKKTALVTEGPYSVVRNPLYLFNFIGGIGFGLAVEQPLLALLFSVGFFLIYPNVVAREEAELRRIFGERYHRYAATTARWLPRWGNFHEPEQVVIDPRVFRKGIRDANWIILLFLLWEIVEYLRAARLLPNLF